MPKDNSLITTKNTAITELIMLLTKDPSKVQSISLKSAAKLVAKIIKNNANNIQILKGTMVYCESMANSPPLSTRDKLFWESQAALARVLIRHHELKIQELLHIEFIDLGVGRGVCTLFTACSTERLKLNTDTVSKSYERLKRHYFRHSSRIS